MRVESEPELHAASHLPVLLACVAATSGPVLEVGVGHVSTPVLHSVCCPGRELVSLESDDHWRLCFQPHYSIDGHVFGVDNDETIKSLCLKHWSVVFIDDSPGFSRSEAVRLFLPVSEYVVVHDAEGEDIMVPMRPVIAEVPNQLLYKWYHPWTLALSWTRPIPRIP